MAGEDPFEGLLGKLTTEQGKEDLVREAIKRDEGVEVVSVERTSTGWRVIAERKPGAGGAATPGGEGATTDEWYYWWYDGYRWPRIPLDQLGPDYKTRNKGIGYIKLVGREKIAEIENSLGRINDNELLNYTDPKLEWEGFCHPDLIYSLADFWDDFRLKYGVLNMLPIVSGYRRVGTHVPPAAGRPGDPSGGGDYVDGAKGTERAHWQGLSVDFRWRFWADRKEGIIARYFHNDDDAFERYINGYNLQRTLRHIEYERNHVSLM
jgi:hypothetical protein